MTHAAKLRVVVADDHPTVLSSVSDLLEANGMIVVARVADGDSALAAIENEQPDAALLDLVMPSKMGIEVARQARYVSPATVVILFTGYGERATLREAFDSGVRGIVLKDAPVEDVLRAIRIACDGGSYVDGRLGGAQHGTDAELTERELAMLSLLAAGLRNDEIGQRLLISPETVKSHITTATRKLGAKTRTQAVAEALRKRLII